MTRQQVMQLAPGIAAELGIEEDQAQQAVSTALDAVLQNAASAVSRLQLQLCHDCRQVLF